MKAARFRLAAVLVPAVLLVACEKDEGVLQSPGGAGAQVGLPCGDTTACPSGTVCTPLPAGVGAGSICTYACDTQRCDRATAVCIEGQQSGMADEAASARPFCLPLTQIPAGVSVTSACGGTIVGTAPVEPAVEADAGGGPCAPSCGERVCGDDGCGESCGECAENETCVAGLCTSDAPTCAAGTFTCSGNNAIALCMEGKLEVHQCADLCAESGMASAGCGPDATSGHDACICDEPCIACIYLKCPSELKSCDANAQCFPLLECVGACSSDSCTQTCASKHPGGVQALVDLLDCRDAKCKADCGQ